MNTSTLFRFGQLIIGFVFGSVLYHFVMYLFQGGGANASWVANGVLCFFFVAFTCVMWMLAQWFGREAKSTSK